MREAAVASAAWISIGLSFTFVVWTVLGGDAANQYLAGFIIEKSLSVDNLFVWAMIFSYFSVPLKYQHRVLFWGIFGAIGLRAIFVFAGIALLDTFSWLLYVFGGLLIVTAIRLARADDHDLEPEKNPILRLIRRLVPISKDLDGQKLFTRINGRRVATPLFIVLVMIEGSDVVFAVDSVPAILAISRDQFVVLSSNIMAILGLRALYFLLAGAKDRLVYLDEGLAAILFFVGVKMIIAEWYHIDTLISLGVIAAIMTIAVAVSLKSSKNPAAIS
jgi:tellurite resistance protein TerC